MPKFNDEESRGEGIVRLKTLKEGDNFVTSCECDLKGVNTEGAIDQLRKLADKLYKEDLCSQGRTCEKCGELIPNHYVNDLCTKCYAKETQANEAEKRVDNRKYMPPVIERPRYQEDVTPV